jgi:hypothetical protein
MAVVSSSGSKSGTAVFNIDLLICIVLNHGVLQHGDKLRSNS